MFSRERRRLPLSGLIIAFALVLFGTPNTSVNASLFAASRNDYVIHLPVIATTPDPFTGAESVMQFLNYMRYHAGVPAAVDDPKLNDNCFEHARYMAENNVLTHQQNPQMPYYSDGGQKCAEKANAWLGTESPSNPWKPLDALYSWRTSVAHRLWMLYPTTTIFGYGFYATDGQRGGAAIDVLSTCDFNADERYKGWPVQYPGPSQRNIPASPYPITLNWRYFGPKPELYEARLSTADGKSIPHIANTDLDAGHKGIQILPKVAFPENTMIKVYISGAYEGRSFNYAWNFTTGSRDSAPANVHFDESSGPQQDMVNLEHE